MRMFGLQGYQIWTYIEYDDIYTYIYMLYVILFVYMYMCVYLNPKIVTYHTVHMLHADMFVYRIKLIN